MLRPSSLVVFALVALSGCAEANSCVATREQAIIDGTVASSSDSPATAAVLVRGEVPGEVLAELACSAVLIAPDVVLTAAHCIALYQEEEALDRPPIDWFVSFTTDVSSFEREGGVLPTDAVRVRAVTLHPEFSLERRAPVESLGKMDDLALLFLTEPVTSIAPASLLAAGDLLVPGSVQIAGYGLVEVDDPERGLGVKRVGESTLFEVGSHELRVGRALSEEDDASGLADKCYGDSGGPTFMQTSEGVRLIGITSRGYKAGAGCGIAGMDTRVDSYEDWIVRVASEACFDGRRDAAHCHWDVARSSSRTCL